MTDIAAWIADRLPANADLAPDELGRLAHALRAEEELWRPLVRHDETERYYAQLYRDPNVDIWLICWLDGQATGYHDHDRSGGGVVVCDGVLNEDFFVRGADGWVRESTRQHAAGGSFTFDSTYIHGVRHPGGDAPPATSIHCYSPALWRMGHYEPDANGVMRRVAVTYADELLGVV
jgi:Cysteine dioxygenase type I